MRKEHLKYFKVKNFKRFDSLELADIGQFNMIVGDNNVGKTSVLEALLFDIDRRKCLANLHKTLFLKGLSIKPVITYGSKGQVSEVQYPDENFLQFLFKKLSNKLFFDSKFANGDENSVNIQMTEYQYDPEDDGDPRVSFLGETADNRYLEFTHGWALFDNDPTYGPTYEQDYDTEISGIYEHFFKSNIENLGLPLLYTSLLGNGSLSKSYFENVSLSRQAKLELIENLKVILPNAEDFEIRKVGGMEQLVLGMKNMDELMPVSTFGESVSRVTQILLELTKWKGKRLMIDEIDTGIHYSRMKNFLKTVFRVALKNDVQLFMTTHSLECQQAFAEVFEEPDMMELQAQARQYSLIETPEGQVVANPYNFEQLQHALEIGFETRGGKRGW